jgi:hypothetical protein
LNSKIPAADSISVSAAIGQKKNGLTPFFTLVSGVASSIKLYSKNLYPLNKIHL